MVTVAVDGEGRMELLPLSDFTVDWRFDVVAETWNAPRILPSPFSDEE